MSIDEFVKTGGSLKHVSKSNGEHRTEGPFVTIDPTYLLNEKSFISKKGHIQNYDVLVQYRLPKGKTSYLENISIDHKELNTVKRAISESRPIKKMEKNTFYGRYGKSRTFGFPGINGDIHFNKDIKGIRVFGLKPNNNGTSSSTGELKFLKKMNFIEAVKVFVNKNDSEEIRRLEDDGSDLFYNKFISEIKRCLLTKNFKDLQTLFIALNQLFPDDEDGRKYIISELLIILSLFNKTTILDKKLFNGCFGSAYYSFLEILFYNSDALEYLSSLEMESFGLLLLEMIKSDYAKEEGLTDYYLALERSFFFLVPINDGMFLNTHKDLFLNHFDSRIVDCYKEAIDDL